MNFEDKVSPRVWVQIPGCDIRTYLSKNDLMLYCNRVIFKKFVPQNLQGGVVGYFPLLHGFAVIKRTHFFFCSGPIRKIASKLLLNYKTPVG